MSISATEKQRLREVNEVIREEPLMHSPILAAVTHGPKTIGEIADAVGAPTEEVVYWVMGMRRYGLLVESGEEDDDGYFSYGAVGQDLEVAELEECES
jgi:predicted Rossmann fold nucleotide-binding protein DprA/Smf involved in DNA uptake